MNPVAFNGQPVAILQGSTYGPWRIWTPNSPNPRSTTQFIWYPHVTAPLPLQSIQGLIVKAVALEENPLLPHAATETFTQSVLGRNFIAVKRSFFQSPATGINPNYVTDDMLGFFSMVLSYAKHADDAYIDESPKNLLSIMPRTDFTTLFNTIRRFVPGTNYPSSWRPGSLYSLIKILACYVEIDSVLESVRSLKSCFEQI